MQIALRTPTTPQLTAALDLPNRLAVQRSPAFEMLDTNAETETTLAAVRQRMTAEMRRRVGHALCSIDLELSLPGEVEIGHLAAGVSRFLAIAGGGMLRDARTEFTDQIVRELSEMPFLLVEPALREAPRRVEFPGKLLPWITQQIEARMLRLTREREVLMRLQDIAGGAQ